MLRAGADGAGRAREAPGAFIHDPVKLDHGGRRLGAVLDDPATGR